MSPSEMAAVIGGLLVGYFFVRSYIEKRREPLSRDFDNAKRTDDRTQHREHDERHDHNADSLEECFSILGVTSGASSEELKGAYKRKMNEYHPDKVAHLGDKLKIVADVEAKRITTAYSRLKQAGFVKST